METTAQELGVEESTVRIALDPFVLEGTLCLPPAPDGLVLFAQGSGDSRANPRNHEVARTLQQANLGTLLMDLLTAEEERVDEDTRLHRFDIDLLAGRVVVAMDWLQVATRTRHLPIGLFAASTGAAAALVAAAERPVEVRAIVARGGRPDLAGPALRSVHAPTLLVVGANDEVVLSLNHQALDQLASTEQKLVVVPGASHQFDEPGALPAVSRLAAQWFRDFLPAAARRR